MLRRKRIETISFSEFMAPTSAKRTRRSADVIAQVGAGSGALMAASPAGAKGVSEAVVDGFDPLINLIMSLSYPIAGVMLSGAALMIMINQKDRGYTWMFNAAIGYVLVQMSPLLMDILKEVGRSAVGEA
ncbi:hypothetical protein D7Z54_33300 [Salibacterium salarium]|uniref:TrbC/VIRB2 family protein n=1 Tax=Salibacterium salarium TaxID=284579 RepID=A0A3R9WLM8_9BACI|nr:hypothetical protein [Salibacterium salarium]RSL29059.1 hypothetical protein D7Z54_33300 [Salibacterium salarium]